ncbi:hypothetical protein FDECE_2106 [Fusarium decemcellulare]|nr:hypothetical protein FDECE_2106 [Fusarium decemcellulare]
MSPVSLLDLSTELLLAVCDHFRGTHEDFDTDVTFRYKDDTRALVNLGKTCRTLYQIALPLMYRDFYNAEWENYNILGFLRIINLRPNLAALVHELGMIVEGMFVKTEKDWRFILQEADRRGIPLPHDWDPLLSEEDFGYKEQYNLSVGILADLFFSTTMHIRNISLELNANTKYGIFMPPLARLLSLRELRVCSDIEKDETDLESMSEFLKRAPNLESLEIYGCDLTGSSLTVGNVRHLKLNSILFGRQGLCYIVKACPRLESFCLQMYEEWENDVPQSLAPSPIPEALLPCKNTLWHIEIKLTGWCELDAEVITSFKEFTALENLLLSGNCLFRSNYSEQDFKSTRQAPVPLVDLLPASIKTFGINGQFPHLYEHMLILAREVKGGRLPRLQHSKWTGFFDSIPRSGFDSLKDAMRDSGVTLKLQYGDIPGPVMGDQQ